MVPTLRAHARTMVANHEAADRLVCDTLDWAVEHVAEYRPDSDMASWLIGIMCFLAASPTSRDRLI
ncbi:hypothetical protein [Paracoccus aurantius]|uniref:hypothetical protein n=1 Tax=Paracoccus aurantius TaxID=3073814 RepID=UPI0038FC6F49